MMASKRKLNLYLMAMTSSSFIGDPAYLKGIRNCKDLHIYPESNLNELLQHWNINNSQSQMKMLYWLQDEGHRAEFNRLRHFLLALSESERNQYLYTMPEGDNRKAKLLVVNKYLRRLPEASIAAYDYALYIILCHAGGRLKHLTSDAIFPKSMEAATKAQPLYTGWDEYILACTAGMEFHSNLLDADRTAENEKAYGGLFLSKSSLLNQVDWNMNLKFKYK